MMGEGMWFYYADVIAWLEYFFEFFSLLLSNAIGFSYFVAVSYHYTKYYLKKLMNESNTHKFHSKNDEDDEIHIFFFLYEKFDINFTLTAHSMNRE